MRLLELAYHSANNNETLCKPEFRYKIQQSASLYLIKQLPLIINSI